MHKNCSFESVHALDSGQDFVHLVNNVRAFHPTRLSRLESPTPENHLDMIS